MRNNTSRSAAVAGFTLIEVLVALAVFSLAALALIRLESASVRGAAVVDRSLLAGMVARDVALDAATAGRAPALGESAGVEQQGGRAWRWTRAVAATGDTAVVRVEVAVQGPTGQVLAHADYVRSPAMDAAR